MKCASCGLPLSPTRTNCPRCGTAVPGGQPHHTPNGAPISWAQQQPGTATPQMQVEVQQPNWSPSWNGSQAPFSQQAPTAQPGNTPPYPLSTSGSNYGANQQPYIIQNTPAMPPMRETATPGSFQQSSTFSPSPHTIEHSQKGAGKRRMPFGFTIATLCVVTGGLLLIFVYILSGPLSSSANNSGQTPSSTKRTVAVTPSPTPPPPSPTPTSFPGAQYISGVQTASTINRTTAMPITLATTFKVKQTIYVTFDTHPGGHNGGVCLIWYLNGKSLSGSSYAFSVGSVSSTAYSFTTMSAPGSADVEIYWSLLSSCSDPNKVLAQRANFTVRA